MSHKNAFERMQLHFRQHRSSLHRCHPCTQSLRALRGVADTILEVLTSQTWQTKPFVLAATPQISFPIIFPLQISRHLWDPDSFPREAYSMLFEGWEIVISWYETRLMATSPESSGEHLPISYSISMRTRALSSLLSSLNLSIELVQSVDRLIICRPEEGLAALISLVEIPFCSLEVLQIPR